MTNPTELKCAIAFGGLYALVLLASAWLSDVMGSQDLYTVATVAGLTDIDAITLSTLRLSGLGGITANQAITAITLAFIANLIFKSTLVWTIGGWHMARHVIAAMSAIGAGLILGWLLV